MPESARARLARASTARTTTSLLPVPGAAGIESVGLDAIGEVMGCFALNLGWTWSGWDGGFGLFADFGPY